MVKVGDFAEQAFQHRLAANGLNCCASVIMSVRDSRGAGNV
jgi:hypothetical protein